MHKKGAAGGPGERGGGWWSNICVHINQGEQQASETDRATQGSSVGKESLKTSDWKNLWGLQWWEKLPASQEGSLERPIGL